MAEPKDKSLEELQKLKLQSEIAKDTAEAERAVKETQLFQKQFEDRWYSKKNLKRMATGAITAFALWGIVRVIINPVIHLREDKREWEIKATEAENQFYAAEFKNIKKERDGLESQKLALAQEKTFFLSRIDALAQEKTFLLSRIDSMKAINSRSIKSTQERQNKYARLSAEYTRLSKTQQDITASEKRRLEKLASEAEAKNDTLQAQVTRLTLEKASLERASLQIKKIAASPYLSEDGLLD